MGGEGPGPVIAWFHVLQVPAGGAPEEIRAAWVDLPLPVRRSRPSEGPTAHYARDVRTWERKLVVDGVPVEAADVQRILRMYDRDAAADWWAATSPGKALVFRRHEGRLMPTSLAVRLWPELADY